MPTLIVMFDLRPGVRPADYERWARDVDVPTVKRLRSVDDFRVHRSTGLLTGDGRPPYAYTEVIEVNDLVLLGEEVAGDTMQGIAAQFREFADDPVFVVAEPVV
jgi:hypothetical protein